jgi:hypothetical protein
MESNALPATRYLLSPHLLLNTLAKSLLKILAEYVIEHRLV